MRRPQVVYYLAERNPMHDNRMEYRVPRFGVAFSSLKDLKHWAGTAFTLVRIRAQKNNRLFG